VEDGAPMELALGHSRFDQSLPTALNESKRVKLSIGEKWEDGIEEKVSENAIVNLAIFSFLFLKYLNVQIKLK
jgi:hypothetical protein